MMLQRNKDLNYTYTEESRVGVDQLGHVARLQVPQDSGLVEVGHVRHIIELLL